MIPDRTGQIWEEFYNPETEIFLILKTYDEGYPPGYENNDIPIIDWHLVLNIVDYDLTWLHEKSICYLELHGARLA